MKTNDKMCFFLSVVSKGGWDGCGVVGRVVSWNVKKTLFRGCRGRESLRKLVFRFRGALAWRYGVGWDRKCQASISGVFLRDTRR